MSSPQPQVKQTNSNQVNNNSSTQVSWETILKTPRIERQHIEYAISHSEEAPIMPFEFIYSKVVSDMKIFPPTSIAISGTGGVIGAILAMKYAKGNIRFITTKEVINADEKSPLFLPKYALELLKKKHNDAQIITIDLGEFEKIKLLLSQGGIYISGLPYEIIVEVAQLAGFGRLWHFSPIQRKFFVF
jgi:hypothetical protein